MILNILVLTVVPDLLYIILLLESNCVSLGKESFFQVPMFRCSRLLYYLQK